MKYSYLISITFVLNGIYSVANKIMADRQDEVAFYMVVMYISATLGALAVTKHQKSKVEKGGALIGGLAGLCIVGVTVSVIGAAALLPGVVVFPAMSGLSLLFVALIGRIVFKEHIGAYGYLGILCGVLAVVLLGS